MSTLTAAHPRHSAVMDEPQEGANAGTEADILSEARWPMAGAVVAAIVLTVLLPPEIRLIPSWLLASVEAVLLLALVLGDPGKIDRRSAALRAVSIGLVAVLVLTALVTTVKLIDSLVTGSSAT